MDNSIKAGQYLYDVLKDQQELTDYVGNKIFPIVVTKEGTTYPFVVYTRDQVSVQYTKVVGHDNTVIITYRVYSDKYDEALEIANIIRNILERRTIKFEDEITINDIKIASLGELYNDDGFCQVISFQMMVE